MLIRLSVPAALAVPLADVKLALRIDFDDDDDRLESLILAETQRYEDFTGRIMAPVDLEYRFDRWGDPLCIPVAPVREVTEVVYLDSANVEQTVSASDWYSLTTDEGVEVWFNDTFSIPTLTTRGQAVRVRFRAGYDQPNASGSGDDPELASNAVDRINIIRMVQCIYDLDELMPDIEMIRTMGNRRIFR